MPVKGWGARLRQLRKGVNQDVFAAQLGEGWNTRSIGMYEKEQRSPNLVQLIRLQGLTGCSLDWIATGEGVPVPEGTVPDEVRRQLEGELAAVWEDLQGGSPDETSRLIVHYLFTRLKFLMKEYQSRTDVGEQAKERSHG